LIRACDVAPIAEVVIFKNTRSARQTITTVPTCSHMFPYVPNSSQKNETMSDTEKTIQFFPNPDKAIQVNINPALAIQKYEYNYGAVVSKSF
jgi:hypothetical protein